MTAVLASRNAHKLAELSAALPGWRIDLVEADDFPPEDAETYEENARLKARFARARGPRAAWALGEDSGIEVDALGGRPGVRSARYAGGHERLLRELGRVDDRAARYVCSLVAISPGGDEVAVRGTLEGRIAREARGSEGFGYDPVFVPGGETRTVAELGNAWKRERSHRARAARALAGAVAVAAQAAS